MPIPSLSLSTSRLQSRGWAVLVSMFWFVSTSMAHPKPGAHADVRYTIDKDAVRVECLMNLRFAEQLISWPRASRDEVDEVEAALGKIGLTQYLGGAANKASMSRPLDRTNRVLIDGLEVSPKIIEYCIIRPPLESRPGFVDVTQAMLPQILVRVEYPCKTPPKRVSIVWGSYPRDFLAQDRDVAPISDIEAILIAFGEVVPITFREHEPEYSWHAPATSLDSRFKAVPKMAAAATPRFAVSIMLGVAVALTGLLAVGLCLRAQRTKWAGGLFIMAVAAPFILVVWTVLGPAQRAGGRLLPTQAESVAIFEPLHANIYRAFDYTQESEIYDALARSVDGPMLATVYDDIYRSLVMHEEGGALSRVKAVTPVVSTADDAVTDPVSGAISISVLSQWRVEGVVYHWGHSHTRLNEYKARYQVESRAGGWRIVGVEPLEQRRLDIAGCELNAAGASEDAAR